MMDYPEILETVSRVKYKDWKFEVFMDGPRPILQLHLPGGWKSRKWFLSPHMSHCELVQTCLKAVLTAEEHEARENFTYLGVAVFGPHLDLDELCAIAKRPKLREAM